MVKRLVCINSFRFRCDEDDERDMAKMSKRLQSGAFFRDFSRPRLAAGGASEHRITVK